MRFRFLLRPGWLAMTFAVIVFAVACYAILAPWQFRRNAERVAMNDAITSAVGASPMPMTTVIASGQRNEYRQVTMTGTYLPADEALARLRVVDESPAFEVLTPFRLVQGPIVLVDRGYIRPVQGVQVPSYAAPPTGTVTLTARLRTNETDPKHRPAFSDASTQGHRQVYAVDSRTVASAAGISIEPGYVQLDAGSPGVLQPLDLPNLDPGPFLSYAIQWLIYGSTALFALVYFTWREIKPGGALTEPQERPTERVKRKSVAELLAEDEATERAPERHATT